MLESIPSRIPYPGTSPVGTVSYNHHWVQEEQKWLLTTRQLLEKVILGWTAVVRLVKLQPCRSWGGCAFTPQPCNLTADRGEELPLEAQEFLLGFLLINLNSDELARITEKLRRMNSIKMREEKWTVKKKPELIARTEDERKQVNSLGWLLRRI